MTGLLYLVAKPDIEWEIILIPKHDSMMQILNLASKVEIDISQGTGTMVGGSVFPILIIRKYCYCWLKGNIWWCKVSLDGGNYVCLFVILSISQSQRPFYDPSIALDPTYHQISTGDDNDTHKDKEKDKIRPNRG